MIPGWTRVLAGWQRAANARALQDLPMIQIGPLMTDDDVDFHSDLIELRCQLDDLHAACTETGEKLRGRVNLVDAQRFSRDWREQQWPADEALTLIIAWRTERDGVPA